MMAAAPAATMMESNDFIVLDLVFVCVSIFILSG
jgi:hypothetical protein